MITIDSLKQQWLNVVKVKDGYSQIDEEHPLEWHIGYDCDLRKSLCVTVSNSVDSIKSSVAFHITRFSEDNDKCQLFISLEEEKLEEVFVQMIIDLFNYSSKGKNIKDASELLKNRFFQWEKLFKKPWGDILTGEQQRGLIGELLFLIDKLKTADSQEAVLDGWFGPECEHQDFYYGDTWFEIKTIKENGEKVKISSLQQLSPTDKGQLIVYFLHKCASNEQSFSLNSLVQKVKDKISDNVRASDAFTIKLSQSGYVELPEYSEDNYTVTSRMDYRVSDDFPRITVNNVDPAIVSASYSLSIAAITKWKIEGNKQ